MFFFLGGGGGISWGVSIGFPRVWVPRYLLFGMDKLAQKRLDDGHRLGDGQTMQVSCFCCGCCCFQASVNSNGLPQICQDNFFFSHAL